MAKEEVTRQEKFTAWMVTRSNCRSKVEYTDKPMTPQKALNHFGASAVMGLNREIQIK